MPSALCRPLNLMLVAVCGRPWYSHFIRWWNDTQTTYLLGGNVQTYGPQCLQTSGKWHQCTKQMGIIRCGRGDRCQWAHAFSKRQLLFSPRQPLLLSNVNPLLFEFPVFQKSEIQTFSLKCFNFKKHSLGIMKHAMDLVWHLGHQSSNSGWAPQGVGQTAGSESWLYHILCYFEQLNLSKPQFSSNESNSGTYLYLKSPG